VAAHEEQTDMVPRAQHGEERATVGADR
jgi:hypothetical protein